MIIRKKENCREGAARSWFLLTCDFASLEARLAAIDTFKNDCPNKPFISATDSKETPDPVLYNVYKDGSDTSDLHSMTGFGTFVKSVNMKAIRVHDDADNKDYVFAPTSNVRVKRADGTEAKIKAKDLVTTDHILEHCAK